MRHYHTIWKVSLQSSTDGIRVATDIAQEIMEDLLRELEDDEVYIDDIRAFSMTWEDHIALLDKTLEILENNGLSVNPLKCEWGVQ